MWAAFDTESVVVTRQSPAGNGALNVTTLYSGACDFQSGTGSTFMNASGTVDVTDAWLTIESILDAKPGDLATVTQNSVSTVYNVVNVSIFTGILPHTELALKRGPLDFKNR